MLSQRLGVVADKALQPSILHQWEMLAKKEVPAGPRACTGRRQPQNTACSSSAQGLGCSFPVRGRFLLPLAPGTGRKPASAFRRMFCFCGAHVPRRTSFRNRVLRGLRVAGPVAWAAAFQDAPKWRTLLCVFQQLLFDSGSFVHSLVADGRVEELLLVRVPVKN